MERTDNPVVLVVEDDPPVRELLQDVLQDEGYDVVAAHDGAMALQVLSSLKVDLITLDLDMPGLSGSELVLLLRKRKIAMPPIVVVTGQIPVKRAVKQMAQAVVTKPFDVDELISAVLKLLPGTLPLATERLRVLTETKRQVAPSEARAARKRKPKGRNTSAPLRARIVGSEDASDAKPEE